MVTCTTCPGTYLISYKLYIRAEINYMQCTKIETVGKLNTVVTRTEKMRSTMVINVKIFYKMTP